MAGLRKFKCYREVKRAYTRKSKYKRKSYIKGVPISKVVRYSMGNPTKKYKYEVSLTTNTRVQVRHNAIESARLTSNRQLEAKLGKTDYAFRIRTYPHHILRENRMLVGAGADRMQTGMKQAFGKVVGIAAQLKKDQKIFSVFVNKAGVEVAKDAMKSAIRRLPFKGSVTIHEIKA
ncbi:MAG: 50S ribosomal protein L16 [Nanoarchaeota archaeon]|nr:50S ribosomal protein L16 [Nanoarchaeota archaeon]|tara:strand:+ start:312 stop:839 length:528 start_codon:yes stop_codon:yes gene_type:complete